jgi:hypothetical protein
MENIEEGMEPKKAFNEVGLNIYEVRESKEGEKKATVESFYSQLAYFGDAEAVNSLMHNNDPNHYELSPDMLKKITHDERGFFEKFRNTNRPDLLALTNLEKVLENPTDNEMAEARKILDATKIVYEKMKKDHLAINKHENELALIDGVEVETKNRTKREEILKKMETYLTDLNRLLPPVHNPLNVPTSTSNNAANAVPQNDSKVRLRNGEALETEDLRNFLEGTDDKEEI